MQMNYISIAHTPIRAGIIIIWSASMWLKVTNLTYTSYYNY